MLINWTLLFHACTRSGPGRRRRAAGREPYNFLKQSTIPPRSITVTKNMTIAHQKLQQPKLKKQKKRSRSPDQSTPSSTDDNPRPPPQGNKKKHIPLLEIYQTRPDLYVTLHTFPRRNSRCRPDSWKSPVAHINPRAYVPLAKPHQYTSDPKKAQSAQFEKPTKTTGKDGEKGW
jgi:hypothetical protein